MKKTINIIAIILAVILQITIATKIDIYYSMINLPLLIMISLILIKRFDLVIWWVASGILLDLVSPIKFGFYTITFIIIYLFTSFIVKKIFYQSQFYIVILFFTASSIIIDIPFLIYHFNSQILIGNFIYNTIVGCIIYWFLKFYLEQQSIIKIKT